MVESVDPGRLDGVQLFSELSPEEIGAIAPLCRWSLYAENEPIFEQERPGGEVFFVVTGMIRILAMNASKREVALATLTAGDTFGELAAIDGKGRSARAVSMVDSVVASMGSAEFISLLRLHGSVAVRIVKRFAQIIRNLDERVTDLSTLSENQRVLVELVKLARPDPRQPGVWAITELPNHKEIASWAGASREMVAQTIGELARDGVVERRTMGLLIKDWARLQLMVRV